MSATDARIEAADAGRHRAIARYVAHAQADAARHVTYVGNSAESMLGEFAEADRWMDRLLVARVGGDVAGTLLADIDEEIRRVWWIGPWADTEQIAIELMDEARTRFGSLFDEEEMAPDSRNDMVRSVAAMIGFAEGTWSSVLSKPELDPIGPMSSAEPTADQSDEVALLHDRLFPGTHTTGAKLVAAEGTRIRTVTLDGRPAGYIAFEVQPDGTGYIDFLGVAPDARRRGLGRALVIDACRELAREGVPAVHLTVRADAPGAIDLYRSAGFAEERLIIPCRVGFTLD